MRFVEAVMSRPRVYELWQAPFADRKLKPLLASGDVTGARRVLDVACGPGTNAKYFTGADYLGVDINPEYVQYAERRYGRAFIAADVVSGVIPSWPRYDFILVNSFLHHLDDREVRLVLAKLQGLLAPGGAIHVLELVLPASIGPARLLARWDRGRHARTLATWQALLSEAFGMEVFMPYSLRTLGVPLWHMVYFKGRLP